MYEIELQYSGLVLFSFLVGFRLAYDRVVVVVLFSVLQAVVKIRGMDPVMWTLQRCS